MTNSIVITHTNSIYYAPPQSGGMEITMNLLGIDVGTTSLKAAAFDSEGRQLASATVDYTLITENGFIEFEALISLKQPY